MSSKTKLASFGGIPVRNKEQISSGLICQHCHLLLLDPQQLTCCGARLCRHCAHRGLSNHKPFTCPYCNEQHETKSIKSDRAAGRDILSLAVACYKCSWTGVCKEYLIHLQNEHAILRCPDCPERFFAINSCEEHRDETCPNRLINCDIPNCTIMVKRSEMEQHIQTEEHQLQLVRWVAEASDSKMRSKFDQGNDSAHFVDLERRWTDAQETIESLRGSHDILNEEYLHVKTECESVRSEIEKLIVEIRKKRETHASIDQSNEQCNRSLTTTNTEIDAVKSRLESLPTRVLDDQSMIVFAFTTLQSSFSPRFKTSSHGHTFLIRVTPTIHSTQSKQNYFSVFIMMLRTDCDSILRYPFTYDISFCLYDQSLQRKHIIKTLKPDVDSPAFARPQSEKNEETGFRDFCPLEILTDSTKSYMKDGSFFLGVFIDFLRQGSNPFG